MKTETFFEKFELLADVPGAVEKLRELILQLAVTGRIVSQDSTDESAALLLQEIYKHNASSRNGKSDADNKASANYNGRGVKLPPGWASRPLNKSQFCAKGSNLDLRGERVWK